MPNWPSLTAALAGLGGCRALSLLQSETSGKPVCAARSDSRTHDRALAAAEDSVQKVGAACTLRQHVGDLAPLAVDPAGPRQALLRARASAPIVA